MRRVQQRHVLSDKAGFLLPARFALLVGVLALGFRLHGQAPLVITNLAQLTQVVAREQQVVADVQLSAVVFACDTDSGALVLQDASGAELLEVDGLRTEFKAGDQIEIAGKPLLFSSSDVGIYVSTAPLLNNDGAHPPKAVNGECSLAAGRHSVRVDWFNQVAVEELAVGCAPLQGGTPSPPATGLETNLLRAVSAECYEGFWSKLPNFQLLQPVRVGSVTNFDIGFQTRREMVGIRFEGYIDAPLTGKYGCYLRSDDGSRLWIGNMDVPVRKLGSGTPPVAPQAITGEPVTGKDERRLATIDGRVSFATRSGKGMRLELLTEQGTVNVLVANSGSLQPAELLNVVARVSGVAGSVLTVRQRAVLGTLSVASSSELTVIEKSPDKAQPPSVLKTVAQMHNLSRNEVARGLPVDIQGTVTAVAPATERWMVIQDDTRGAFVQLDSVADCRPNVGELWRITGRARPGGFAPVIAAEKASLLGKGRLPEPARPAWSQLVNGSMDVQWVELQGVVTSVSGNLVSLLLPEGHQVIDMTGWGESQLKAIDKALVRIRGTLFAVWNERTRESKAGTITMYNASIAVEEPAPKNPFDAPEKTPRGLFRVDAKATPLQRVKVLGQVTYVDSKRVFIEENAGIEVCPGTPVDLNPGDLVEAVGYPALPDTGPQLREAILRKTGDGVLREAPLLSTVPAGESALRRVRIEGSLAGVHLEGDTLVMQIQTQSQLFLADVAKGVSLSGLRPGSKLSLTGIYFASVYRGIPSAETSHFELLVHAPGDVVVLSTPSWWTLQRLISVVEVLAIILVVVSVWTAVLRRQVAQRTSRLQQEIREREHAERQRALEAERARIARDLHDELGSGLTEMGMLANAGFEEQESPTHMEERFHKIAERARTLVAGLDVIVWAIDPRRNSLQAFADYLECYADELLSTSRIHYRFKIPVEFKAATLSGAMRHSLLLAVKEALTNVIHHASASEVELQIKQPEEHLEIVIADDGHGFDPQDVSSGDGLRNLQERMQALGGGCRIESAAGKGTTVTLSVPLAQDLSLAETR